VTLASSGKIVIKNETKAVVHPESGTRNSRKQEVKHAKVNFVQISAGFCN
jgi:hypothetical protein